MSKEIEVEDRTHRKSQKRNKDGVMEPVKGFVPSPKQVEARAMACSGSSHPMIARKLGIPATTVLDWTRKFWWTDFIDEHLKQRNKEFHARFVNLDGKIIDSMSRVAESEDPKTASAQVNLLSNRLQVGGEAALIKKGGAQVLIDNSQTVNKAVNIDFSKLTAEQVWDIAHRGSDALKLINPEGDDE